MGKSRARLVDSADKQIGGTMTSSAPKSGLRILAMIATAATAASALLGVSAITSPTPANAAVTCETVSLLASTTSNEVRFYSVAGVLERSLPIAEPLKAITVTPDGKTIYGTSISNPGAVLTIDSATGATLNRQPITGAGASSVADAPRHALLIMPNGQIRFGASSTLTGLLLNPTTGVVTTSGSYPPGSGPVGGLTLLPDGDFLAGTRSSGASTNHVARFRPGSTSVQIATTPAQFWGFAQSGSEVYGLDDSGNLSLVTSPVRDTASAANLPTTPIASLGSGITGLASPQDTGCTPFFTQSKSVDERTYSPGQDITYEVTVTNTGQGIGTASLTDQVPASVSVIGVTCSPTGSASCSADHLGNAVTGEATVPIGDKAVFTITATVESAGNLTNTAAIEATTAGCTLALCGGGNATSATVFSVDPTVTVSAAVSTNGGQPVNAVSVGQVLDYNYTVTNSGTVDIEALTIEQTFSGSGSLPAPVCDSTTLTPSATTSCTTSYTVTQADLDAGVLNNSVVAAANATGSSVTVRSAPASADLTLDTIAELHLDKFAALEPGGTGVAGDTVEYSFELTNTGTATLSGVTVNDTLAGLSAINYDWPGASGVLAPGQRMFATASYTIVQSDVDNLTLTNEATAEATSPGGATVTSAPSSVTLDLLNSPALSITKTFDDSALSSAPVPGEVITYQFSATNAGTVTLTDVNIVDNLTGVSDPVISWPGAEGVLAPGESITATATYAINQSDIDSGSVENEALVEGTTPSGDTVAEQSETVITPIVQSSALTLSNVADTSGLTSPPAAGDTVEYTFTVTNTGNTSLTNTSIAPTLPGITALSYTWPGTPGILLPGEAATATASYDVTQADLNAAAVVGSATASATGPDTNTVFSSASSLNVPLTQASTLSIDTTADSSQLSAPPAAGETITFSYSATNTGNTTLTAVTIVDTLPGISAPSYSWPNGVGILQPGDTVTASATYNITQADLNAGIVSNMATVTGEDPDNTAVTSPDASVSVPLTLAGEITVTNNVDDTGLSAPPTIGDTLNYSGTFANTGNVTLTNVTPTNTLFAIMAPNITWPGTPGTLSPGEEASYTGTHQLTQTNIDDGEVVSTTTVIGDDPALTTVTSNDATQTTPLSQVGSLTLTMTDDASALANPPAPGNVITYNFTLTNTGNTTLTAATIAATAPELDSISITWPGPDGILAPGQIATATADATITQANIDAGQLDNQATAVASDPTAGTVTSNTVSLATPLPPTAGLSLERSVDESGLSDPPQVGDSLVYTYTLANGGNITLTNIGITDTLFGLGTISIDWPGTQGTLRPGETATATSSHLVSQTDIDDGSVFSEATASGTAPNNDAVSSPATSLTVPLTQLNALNLSSSADTSGLNSPPVTGDPVVFNFVITNTGNTTLTDTALNDTLASLGPIDINWPGAVGTLAPGATATASATASLTLAQLNIGEVVSEATATATAPDQSLVTSPVASETVSLTRSTALTLTTEADTSALGAPPVVGDSINYTFTITNSGNVAVSAITLTPTLPGLSSPSFTWPGTPGTLDPGQTATANAVYPITQADLNAGEVTVTSISEGLGPDSSTVVSPPSARSVTLQQTSELNLSASSDTSALSSPPQPGDSITFTFSAENTGNTTLESVGISNTLSGLGSPSPTWPSTPGTLAPGETVIWTASYLITQESIDAGSVETSATANALNPQALPVTSNTETVAATVARVSEITLAKQAIIESGEIGNAGDSITYRFTIHNAGNTTLTGVSLTDPLPGLSPISIDWPGTAGTMTPGSTAVGEASYVVQQSDIETGGILNTATVTANRPDGPPLSAEASASIGVPFNPDLVLTKEVDTSALNVPPRIGDLVTYSFTVENVGNVILNTVTIIDPLPGLEPLNITWPGTPGVLNPGETATATADYLVTANDLNEGVIENVATATALSVSSFPAVAPAASATVVLTQKPALELQLTPDTSALPPLPQASDAVSYTYLLTNTGNVSLNNLETTSSLTALNPVVLTWPGTPGELLPDESATATVSYTLTQADIDAGLLTNSSDAAGTTLSGEPISATQVTTNTTLPRQNTLTLTKTGALDAGDVGNIGDTITYTLQASNTGNTTLTEVSLDDNLPGLGTLTLNWPGGAGSEGQLLPGQTVTGTAPYTITKADFQAGEVVNTATAAGAGPGAVPVSAAPSTWTQPLIQLAALGLSSTFDTSALTAPPQAGQTVVLSYRVENTGNRTLTGISVDDTLPGLTTTGATWPAAEGVLLPGESVTITAELVVTQALIDGGGFSSVANATGLDPDTIAVSSPVVTTELRLDRSPNLGLTLESTSQASAVGDPIDFNLTLRNSGNTSLTITSLTLDLSDTSVTLISNPLAMSTLALFANRDVTVPKLPVAPAALEPAASNKVLLPGESLAVPYRHLVTQGDRDRGYVDAKASAGAASSGVQAQVVADASLRIDLVAPPGPPEPPSNVTPPPVWLSNTGGNLTMLRVASIALAGGLLLLLLRRRQGRGQNAKAVS